MVTEDNTEKFIEYDPFSKEDEFYEGIENEEKAKELMRCTSMKSSEI